MTGVCFFLTAKYVFKSSRLSTNRNVKYAVADNYDVCICLIFAQARSEKTEQNVYPLNGSRRLRVVEWVTLRRFLFGMCHH